MPAQPLKIAVAEFNIDDLTSSQISKINKKLDRTIKQFIKAEREVKKTDGAFRKFGRSLGGIGQRLRGAGRVAGRAGGRLGGGDLGGAIGALPFGLGAAGAAAIASTQIARQQFLGGIQLEREIRGLSSDFAIAFGDAAKEITKELRRGGLFKKEDIQAAFVTLRDLGVREETSAEGRGILGQFARAQGARSIQEAFQNLLGGNIRAGRGLSNIQIEQIRQISPLLGNVQTAQFGFERILSILNQSSDEIGKFADRFTKDLGESQRNLVITQEEQQKTTLAGIKAGIEGFKSTEELIRVQNDLALNFSKVLSPAVSGTAKLFTTVNEEVRGFLKRFGINFGERQSGGNITAGQTVTVGERGPEMFTPRTAGRITNNNVLRNNGGRIVMNNNITINATSAQVGFELERVIKETLNKFSRTTFRMNTGLALSG